MQPVGLLSQTVRSALCPASCSFLMLQQRPGRTDASDMCSGIMLLVACGAVGQPDVREAVGALLRMLSLEPDEAGAPLSQQLASAKRALSEQVLPALKDAQQQRQGQQEPEQNAGHAAANGGAVLDLAQFPLGFSTGGVHALLHKCRLHRGHGMAWHGMACPL